MHPDPGIQHTQNYAPSLLALMAETRDELLQHIPHQQSEAVFQLGEVIFSLLWKLRGIEYVIEYE
jgi:hypothetical protein